MLVAAYEHADVMALSHTGTSTIKQSMRFALYLLVAFAMRRRGLTRRDLRPGRANPSPTLSSRIRFGAPNSAFRMRTLARLATHIATLPYKPCGPSIAYR